jgi:hypothetical protein
LKTPSRRIKGGVEPRVIIPVSAWRPSLCVHGLLQCNDLVAIEKKGINPKARKTYLIPN